MTLDTIGYLAWRADGYAFCVHPLMYVHEGASGTACHLCGTVLTRKLPIDSQPEPC